jgi:hypothetical protein
MSVLFQDRSERLHVPLSRIVPVHQTQLGSQNAAVAIPGLEAEDFF